MNQQILQLQNNPPFLIPNMATLQDVMSSLSPLIAQIPQYIGQEPLVEYYNRVVQAFLYRCTLGVVGFNDAHMGGFDSDMIIANLMLIGWFT